MCFFFFFQIAKSQKKGQPSASMASDLDMYADDFDSKEKEKLESTSQSSQDNLEQPETGIVLYY